MRIVAVAAIACAGAATAKTAPACAKDGPYPAFCSIPKPPTGLKSPAMFRREVVATRLAGRDLVDATAPSTFTLTDTAGFAERAITEAAPPPPLTTPSDGETEAFAKAARATATPPHPR